MSNQDALKRDNNNRGPFITMKREIKSKNRTACIGTMLLTLILFSDDCALMSKPDSCEHEVNCDLNSVSAAQAIELDVNDSRRIRVCGPRARAPRSAARGSP